MKRLALLLLCFEIAHAAKADAPPGIVEHETLHPKGDAPCSFDLSLYAQNTKTLPIGVFDSGVGGLTVLDAMLRIDAFNNNNLQPGGDGVRDFAAEHFVYFGDQANMPYGNYSAAGRVDLLRELILRDAVFLLRKPVKAIVIACNTATAYGLEDIRTAVKTWGIDVPVVGVVEAGSRGVMELIPANSRPDAIAVFATVGTCSCEAYPKAISRTTGLAGKPMPVIIQQGCVGLAGAIEGDPAFVAASLPRTSPYQGPKPVAAMRDAYGFDPAGMNGDELNSVANHVRYEVATLVERHCQSGNSTPIGMVVLGCTHFPMAQKEIADAFIHLRAYHDASGKAPYADLIREKLTFINPAEFTAKELFRELARAKLRLIAGDVRKSEPDAFFISVPNRDWPDLKLTAAGALDQAYKHGRKLGEFDREDTVAVSLTPNLLLATTAAAIEHLMPDVWRRLPISTPAP